MQGIRLPNLSLRRMTSAKASSGGLSAHLADDLAASAPVLCTLVSEGPRTSLERGTRGYVAAGSRRFAAEAESQQRFKCVAQNSATFCI